MKFYPRLLTVLFLINLTFNAIQVKAQLPKTNPIKEEYLSANQSLDLEKLQVGVAGDPPIIMGSLEQQEEPTGVTIEIWKELAIALKLDYELIYHHSVPEVMKALEREEIDVAIGSINITDKNISLFDFTQPIAQANLTVLVPSQPPTLWTVIKPFMGWVFLSSMGLIYLCLFIVGNLLWLVERRKNSEQFAESYFKGVSEGMWCALATFTTVGYGDRYPITDAGRFISGLWMLISLVTITTLTAGITTTLAIAFSSQPYREIQKPSDLQRVRLAAISDSTAVEWAKYYRARVTEVTHLSDAISLLKSDQVDGVIYTRLTLEHYLEENPQASYQLVQFNLGTQNYGIALTPNNPLTKKLNKKILSIEMQLRFQSIVEDWFQLKSNK